MFEVPVFEPPKQDEKKPMYAAALEHFDNEGQMVNGNIVYTHADDQVSAECAFRAIYSNDILAGKVRIASVGLAVGWFVQDNHGEILAG